MGTLRISTLLHVKRALTVLVTLQSAGTIGQLGIGLCDLRLLVSSEIRKETVVLGNKLRCVMDLASFSVQMTLNIPS